MSRKDLSLKPLALAVTHGQGAAWRYEEGAGITIVVEAAHGHIQVRVPASVMRDFLARFDRAGASRPPKGANQG